LIIDQQIFPNRFKIDEESNNLEALDDKKESDKYKLLGPLLVVKIVPLRKIFMERKFIFQQ
jgi:hypothetical protein